MRLIIVILSLMAMFGSVMYSEYKYIPAPGYEHDNLNLVKESADDTDGVDLDHYGYGNPLVNEGDEVGSDDLELIKEN